MVGQPTTVGNWRDSALKSTRLRKSTRVKIPAIIVILVWAVVSPAASAAPRSISVAVVGADAADPRWGATEEAVGYWNDQLAEIGAGIRLGPLTRLVQPVPQFPTELASLPGDIIVVLSMLDFISFGHPWSPGQKGLVEISRPDVWPRSLPNVLRNLLAHDLGQVLGLGHNDDPAMLMCGRPAACRPNLFTSEAKRFFPLTEAEKTTLCQSWPPQ